MALKAAALKTKLKERAVQFQEPARVRVHRAISWLKRSETADEDPDSRFIFLWIAFNAAYAREFGFEKQERELLKDFLRALLAVDRERRLHKVVFDLYSGPIRVLIDNHFVFEPFWRARREHDSSDNWKKRFAESKAASLRSVMGQDTLVVLTVVFDRLYVLRNQLVHGGATWGGKVNRPQVGDGAVLLGALVPVIIDLMVENPGLDLGELAYPVV